MRFIRGLLGLASVLVFAAGCANNAPSADSKPAAASTATPAPTQSPVERGKYLVYVAGCNDCHTPKKLGPNGPEADMDRQLSGNPASDKLASDFGTWKTPWGEINRFERVSGDIVQRFSDTAASIPVGFTSSRWGSLASFGARSFNGTKRMYGTTGNSFVAIVEFGDRVRARAVTAGGESGDPASPHFNDQALRYSTGDLRDVYFYRSDLEAHSERQYHPGQ